MGQSHNIWYGPVQRVFLSVTSRLALISITFRLRRQWHYETTGIVNKILQLFCYCMLQFRLDIITLSSIACERVGYLLIGRRQVTHRGVLKINPDCVW